MVGAVVERFCAAAGVDAQAAAPVAEAACAVSRFIVDEAYPGGADGEIEIALELGQGALWVRIHDWGRPIASGDAASGELPPELVARAGEARDLRLVNLGREGKLTTFSWPMPASVSGGRPAADQVEHRGPAGVDDEYHALEVRDARPQDAQAISRLLYDHYALGYVHPDFYRPRWVAAQLESASVRAVVAVDGGRVVGHHALLIRPGAACAETGVAVVHPAYRGLGLFGRLMERTIASATAAGLAGVFGEAVTSHPYSQRAEWAHGYRETALLLGTVPAQDEGGRGAQLVSYLMLDATPRRAELPPVYAEHLQRAYRHLDLAASPPEPAPQPAATVRWSNDDERGVAAVAISGWDEDARRRVHDGLQTALARHVDVVHADVALGTRDAVAAAVAELNRREFFYAGLRPHGAGADDAVRLQRLNCDVVDVEDVVCDSDFAKALMAVVVADRERVAALQ